MKGTTCITALQLDFSVLKTAIYNQMLHLGIPSVFGGKKNRLKGKKTLKTEGLV